MTVFVFLGPTLSISRAQRELDASFLPPVSQGDVFRLARRGPTAIGIVDGYFDHVPAVWHKEILWAMDRGIPVFGSASMGALRAAELDCFGMRGVGSVYEDFRAGRLEDDDEVAVAHGVDDDEYRPISEAMVNIRATVAAASRAGVFGDDIAGALLTLAKAAFYPERSYQLLFELARKAAIDEATLKRFREWLPGGAVNVKQLDAITMLRVMHECETTGQWPHASGYRFERTDFWAHVLRTEVEGSDERLESPTSLPSDAVIDELRLLGAPMLDAVDQGLLRDLSRSEAQRLGHGVGDAALEEAESALLNRIGVSRGDGLSQWLTDNDLPIERVRELARTQRQLDKLKWSNRGRPELIDHLRVTGRYTRLKERALDKQARLAAAGLAEATIADTGLTQERLLGWYFTRLGPFYPQNAEQHAERYGFVDVSELVASVVREFLYIRLRPRDSR